MKNRLIKAIFLGLIASSYTINAQTESPDNSKMEWFKNAKLGIFIHWASTRWMEFLNRGRSSIIILTMKFT
ncbi:Alpha-L-fucosidase [Chryseobacterium carnipullorum]|nr:Alpha-L-fucosidase [Chryseobacterium carnipullorum]